MRCAVFIIHFRRLIVPLLLSCTVHFVACLLLHCCSASIYNGNGGGQSELSVWLSSSSVVERARNALSQYSESQSSKSVWREYASPEFPQDASEEWQERDGLAGGGALTFPLRRFYSTSEITVQPLALTDPELEGKAGAEDHVSGSMVLELWINEEGTVIHTEQEIAELPESVARDVVNAFLKLRFTPGELYGRKVGSIMRVEVRYENVFPLQYQRSE